MSIPVHERLLAALTPIEALAPGQRQAASAAREQLTRLGLPTPRDEDWRYTSLRALERLDAGAGHVDLPQDPVCPAGVKGDLLRWRGGAFERVEGLPAGLHIRDVADPPAPIAGGRDAAFRWLHAAAAVPAVEIEVREAVNGCWRLDLAHDSHGLAHCRIHLRLRAGARLQLLEHWHGPAVADGLVNAWLKVELEPGAQLEWLRLNASGAAAQIVQVDEAQLHAGARLAYSCIDLGALWLRHELSLALLGADAAASLRGVFVASGRQHLDTRLRLVHRAGQAQSDTLWKGVALGRSRAVFDGLIEVAPGADGSDARLKTANLLLSAQAEIDAKPELVIEADEVACSHGATVGQIDERALFYLRSRGIPEDLARRLLTVAFCAEALLGVEPAPLREALEAAVAACLPALAGAEG